MKKIWVKIDSWDKELLTTAIEGGAFGVMLPENCSKKAKELGKIQTIAKDGDLKLEKDVIFYEITSSTQEAEIEKLSKEKTVILKCNDWTIIPLENLIAKQVDIIFYAKNFEEAKTAVTILEKGVNQILIPAENP